MYTLSGIFVWIGFDVMVVEWSDVFVEFEWMNFDGWYKMMTGGVDMRWVLLL